MSKTVLDKMIKDVVDLSQPNNKPIFDMINNPPHYTRGQYETIDVIEDWKLNYHLGNAVKYISRCEYKRNKVEDLKKAIWYLEREIERITQIKQEDPF